MEQLFIAILIASSVSIDNLIIAVSLGLCIQNITLKTVFKTSVVFALFSLILYLIGWEVGIYLEKILEHDHYFASAFLIFIGGKMMFSALSKKKDSVNPKLLLNFKMLILFSVATSIDALVIGMSTSLSSIQTLYPGIMIPVFVFLATFLGFYIGNRLSDNKTRFMQILGSLVIIALGIKIFING